METRFPARFRGSTAIAVILLLFVVAGVARYWRSTGDDLASSYVGCRLVADGQASHLYSYDRTSFDEIGDDDTWQETADRGHAVANLHPYVQTPLWAYALQPLCTRMDYRPFARLFNVLSMLSFAACLWLTARYWAPSLFRAYAMVTVALCVYFCVPFQYSMSLLQTHVFFVLMSLAALMLAERARPVSAGLLLAIAVAVKITPVFLVLYWLLTRRWKAVVSVAIWSAVLWGITVALAGRALTHVYLADLGRVSHVLLLYQNNQSFAAWVMGHFYSPDEAYDIFIHPLPTAVRLASLFLTVALTLLGGFIDRERESRDAGPAPLGALLAIVAATAFAPIAWTHYSIVLIAALMLLVHENRRLRSRWVWAAVVGIMALNYRPLAADVVSGLIGRFSILRGSFFAAVLTIVALGLVAWLERSRFRHQVTPQPAGIRPELNGYPLNR